MPEVQQPQKGVGRIRPKPSFYHQCTVTPGNVLRETNSSISRTFTEDFLCARHPARHGRNSTRGTDAAPAPVLASAFPPTKSSRPFQFKGCGLKHESVQPGEDLGTCKCFFPSAEAPWGPSVIETYRETY